MKRRLLLYGLLVGTLLAVGAFFVVRGALVKQPPVALTAFDAASLAREGVKLVVPTTPPKLTADQVKQMALHEAGALAQQATSVSVRRVEYLDRYATEAQPAWLVTLGGLRMEMVDERRYSQSVGGVRKWLSTVVSRLFRGSYNTQLHILLDEDGKRVFSLSYQ